MKIPALVGVGEISGHEPRNEEGFAAIRLDRIRTSFPLVGRGKNTTAWETGCCSSRS